MGHGPCNQARKCHTYHFLFTLVLDFYFRRELIGSNLTVVKLSSPRGSRGRQPRFRKMRACSIKTREPVGRLGIW